jgi:hypothetical protein
MMSEPIYNHGGLSHVGSHEYATWVARNHAIVPCKCAGRTVIGDRPAAILLRLGEPGNCGFSLAQAFTPADTERENHLLFHFDPFRGRGWLFAAGYVAYRRLKAA